MMKLHCAGETLADKNLYSCDVCNLRTCATIERSIQLLGNTLVIAIKRAGKAARLITSVDVFQGGTIKTISQRELTLFAICCHTGTKTAGHCFTYVRTGPNEWFRFNDEEANHVDIQASPHERHLRIDSQLLFYRHGDVAKEASIALTQTLLNAGWKDIPTKLIVDYCGVDGVTSTLLSSPAFDTCINEHVM
jgi:ubiquitin C-terminal hydrolase